MTTGYTIFMPIGLKTDYTQIDLKKQIVQANVSYEGKQITTVRVDLLANSIQKQGSFEEVAHLEKYGISEFNTLKEIQHMAEFFIQNDISNPQKYYEQF